MTSAQNRFDCIVVGGGLIGLLSAYLITRQGKSVLLLEQQQLGRESSWAGGGILSPLYPWRYPDGVSELVNWSRQNWQELLADLKQQSDIDPQSLPCGMLILDQEEQSQALAWAERFDVAMEVIDAGKLRELEPELTHEARQALWMPDVGQVRNPRLLQAVHQAALNNGLTVMKQQPVDQLLLEQGAICGVQSQGQSFFAPKVVVAAGAWSAKLLEQVGYSLPVEPVRGQMIQFQTEPGLIKRITLSEGRYIIPRKDGRVLAGSTLEYTGFTKQTTQQARDELAAAAYKIAPKLAEYEVVEHWAGLRPGSPDGVPMIGELENTPGLYLNCGHFRNGVAMSWASCRLLSDLVTGAAPSLNPNSFAPK